LTLTLFPALLPLAAASNPDPGDDILAKIESANNRRRAMLQDYSVARHYTLQNQRFGKQAATSVVMKYRQGVGEHYTVVTRSGSEKLNDIIDKVIATESTAAQPPGNARHQIAPANYQARPLGTETAGERTCYVLQLIPRVKAQYLIYGKVWVDTATYAVVRLEGQFAASFSALIGTPRIRTDFVQVNGFWMPAHVHSTTSSFLLGSSELNIHFTNYQVAPASL